MNILLNHSMAHKLAKNHPGRIGLMVGPSRMRPLKDLSVALDNDRYSVWTKGKEWDEGAYWRMLDSMQDAGGEILWVVVPDVVGDAVATFREWETWCPKLRNRVLPLALAVQDGMTADAVRRYADPEVIFVGGTTEWKRATLWSWCREFPRVHCGRVNYERWLWHAHRCGCESTDGTGWFRGDRRQLAGLLRYLRQSSKHLNPQQLEILYSGATKMDVLAESVWE